MNEKALTAVVQKLMTYLQEEMPIVEQVIEGFPAPNQDLEFPSISVFLKNPDFRLHAPYTVSKTVPAQGSKGPVYRAYGYYDLSMQVDLWAEYRPKLQVLMEEFTKLFNQSLSKTGISVVLDEYYNEAVTFTLAGLEIVEGEQVSQRNEWRATATVLTGCRAIKEHMEYFIHETENNITTPDEIEEGTDPDYFNII